MHGLIGYTNSKAKCRHLKIFACKGTLRQVFICLRPKTHTPPPYTLNTCMQYSYSHREGGGGELNQREGERGNTEEYRSQSWVENTNLYTRNWLSPVYKLS
jgi:hypothetical protein